KIVNVLRRRQRAHYADAEDFSGERTEAASDFNAVLFKQRGPHLGFVYTLRKFRSVEIPDAMLGRYQHFQSHGFQRLDELQVRPVMAVPAILQAFLFDERKAFVQVIE